MTPLGKEIKENCKDYQMTNSFSLQFWKQNVLASYPTLQQLEYQTQPRLAESTASKRCEFPLLLEQSFSVSPKQGSAAEQNTGQFCPFHLLCWMDCHQLSLCIMNAKAQLQKGVLNRAAVVPGSLQFPLLQEQHSTAHKKILSPQKTQTFSFPPHLATFLLSISASPFCIAEHTSGTGSLTFQCFTLYPSFPLGNRNHFRCLLRQISLVASCFPLPLLSPTFFWSLNNLFT